MNISPETLRLYAVTDRAWAKDEDDLMRQVAEVIDGGSAVVQLREKDLPDEAFLAEAERFVALCREKGAISIINDNVEITIKTNADGVHVGQEDLEAGRVRALLGPSKIIGVSVHTPEEARTALAAGADYLGTGAAFPTETKEVNCTMTPAEFRGVTSAVDIPVVAIGGISRDNILLLRNCGFAGVAVVSALFAQPDVKAAALEMRQLAEEIAEK